MENENKPQQDGQKPDSAPLTAKKKRALLEYLAILCAGAFLIVALSLGIKLISVQNDMEAANRGARENIAALQDNLDKETAKNRELNEDLSTAKSAAELAQAALQEANASLDSLKEENAELKEQAKTAQEAERRAEATELLLEAHTALYEGSWTEFAEKMQALEDCADALSERSAEQYEALKTYLS